MKNDPRTIWKRAARVLWLGGLGGLVVSACAVFTQAQQVQFERVPLHTALHVAAVAAGESIITIGVPETDVLLPDTSPNWSVTLRALAGAYKLSVCELDGVAVISSSESCEFLGMADADTPATTDRPDLATTTQSTDDSPGQGEGLSSAGELRQQSLDETFQVGLRIIEIADQRTSSGNADISALVPAALSAALVGDLGTSLAFSAADLADTVGFFESESIGRQLDYISTPVVSGGSVRLQSGGTVSVNLVGAGQENISRSYTYGLVTDIAAESTEQGARLGVSLDSSAPVSVSDPTLLNITSRRFENSVNLACGEALVLASLFQRQEDISGSGVPGIAQMPTVGYLAGSASAGHIRSSIVVTLELGCDRE